MTEQTNISYQAYKVALETFQKPMQQLDPQQSEEVLRISQRKIQIEEAVLTSPEAIKVVVPKVQIEQALDEVRKRYADAQEFINEIEALGLSEDDFYMAVARELKVEAVLEYVSADIAPVSETDVSLFYYMNLDNFSRPEIRTARHILITINEDNPENSREAAQHKIIQIQRRIEKKPSRFEEQALKHSECPTSLQGGLLGQVKPGTLYPELEKALFSLPVGQLSTIVETELGFHLIRCDEIQKAGTVPLTEISVKLKDRLEQRNRKNRQRQWLQTILGTNKAKVDQGELSNG